MNCKPGDLAVIVRSWAGNEGKIVRCVELVNSPDFEGLTFLDGPRWLIDRPVPLRLGGTTKTVADSALKPIRPNDGKDETLTWAGKPEQVTV